MVRGAEADGVLVFNSRASSDFVIVAEGEEIFTHRSVLMSQSPFLRKFLQGDPSCTRINANNAKKEAMQVVIGALYTIPTDLSPYSDDAKLTLVEKSLQWGAVTVGLGGSAPQHSVPVLVSAWEICLHFQLHVVGHYVVTKLLLPLVTKSNVLRCLKPVMKHRHSSSDAEAVYQWCLDNELLPPELDTAEAAAEWHALQSKFPFLADAVCRSETPRDVVSGAAPARKVEEGENNAARGDHSSRPRSKESSPPQSLASSSGVKAATLRHDSEEAQVVLSRSRSVPTNNVPASSESSVTRSTSPSVSPQRERIRERFAQSQHQLESKMYSELQENVDRAIAEEIEHEKRLLKQEELEYESWLRTMTSDNNALQQQLANLETEDSAVRELVAHCETLDVRARELDLQLSEMNDVHDRLESALRENEEYLRSTVVYLPSAANAVDELSMKMQRWSAAVESLAVGGTLQQVRQEIVSYAAVLRDEKDTALRAIESERRIESALEEHIRREREMSVKLQSMLDAHVGSVK